jgi:hypothetical protein
VSDLPGLLRLPRRIHSSSKLGLSICGSEFATFREKSPAQQGWAEAIPPPPPRWQGTSGPRPIEWRGPQLQSDCVIGSIRFVRARGCELLLAQWSPLWVKFGRKLAVRAESAFPPIADIVDYGRDLRRAFIRSWLRVYEFTH